MNNVSLAKVRVERDLGVLISDDLKVSSQLRAGLCKGKQDVGTCQMSHNK